MRDIATSGGMQNAILIITCQRSMSVKTDATRTALRPMRDTTTSGGMQNAILINTYQRSMSVAHPEKIELALI